MRLKKVKNASEIMKQGKYYIDNPKDYIGKWQELFGNDHPIYIEVGMGKGHFILENAIKYPNINFIGIEKFDSVIVRAIQKTNEVDINNLKLLRIDALELNSVFQNEISLMYLNFSDPWPKEKHAKRRLTSPRFLDIYETIFVSDKHIIMKTDNQNLFAYSLESLKNNGYDIIEWSNNWDIWQDNNIRTEYEEKFGRLGVPINRLEAIKHSSNRHSQSIDN